MTSFYEVKNVRCRNVSASIFYNKFNKTLKIDRINFHLMLYLTMHLCH